MREGMSPKKTMMKRAIDRNGLPASVVSATARRTATATHVTIARHTLPIAQVLKFGVVGTLGACTYYALL